MYKKERKKEKRTENAVSMQAAGYELVETSLELLLLLPAPPDVDADATLAVEELATFVNVVVAMLLLLTIALLFAALAVPPALLFLLLFAACAALAVASSPCAFHISALAHSVGTQAVRTANENSAIVSKAGFTT